MSEPIVFFDTSEILEGKFEELKAIVKELVEFVQAVNLGRSPTTCISTRTAR